MQGRERTLSVKRIEGVMLRSIASEFLQPPPTDGWLRRRRSPGGLASCPDSGRLIHSAYWGGAPTVKLYTSAFRCAELCLRRSTLVTDDEWDRLKAATRADAKSKGEGAGSLFAVIARWEMHLDATRVKYGLGPASRLPLEAILKLEIERQLSLRGEAGEARGVESPNVCAAVALLALSAVHKEHSQRRAAALCSTYSVMLFSESFPAMQEDIVLSVANVLL